MGLLSTLRVKLTADIREYAENMREAQSRATQLQTGLGGIGDGLERMGSSIGRIATVAAGQLIANGITQIGNAVVNAGRQAVTSVADYERLGASLTALMTKEVLANSAAEQTALATAQVGTSAQNASKQTMSMAEAQQEAARKAQDLLGWIQKLAVESPFTREDVAQTFKAALAFGFTSEEAKTITQSLMDFVAATGATGDTMTRLGMALGKIKAKGKVTGEELQQLTEAGFSVNEVLKSMGVGLKDVEKGTVTADKFIAAFTQNVTKNFDGAAKAQAGTFSGLLSSLQDLKDIALRTVFTPLFTAFKPILDTIVSTLSSPQAVKFFTDIGNALMKPLGAIKLFAILLEQGIEPISALRTVIVTTLGPEAAQIFDDIVLAIQNAFTWLQTNWPTIEPILVGIGAAIAAIGAILAASNIYGAIVAVGAVLGTISLPVVAVVAAIGLLAAAWASNFGGIRDTLTAVWEGAIQPALAALWAWLQVNLPIAIQALATFWTTTLQPALETVGTFIATQIVPILADIATWLATNIPIAIQAVVTFWDQTLMPALAAGWDWLNANLFPTLQSLGTLLGLVIGQTIEQLGWQWRNVLLPALEKVWKFLSEDMQPVWKALQDAFIAISPIITGLLDGAWKNLEKSLENVAWLLKEAKKFFDGLIDSMRLFKLPPELERHSPSPLEQTFMGVRDTLKDIHTLGLPDFSGMGLPMLGASDLGMVGGANREITMTINVGAMGDGLDMYDTARAIGREVARRL